MESCKEIRKKTIKFPERRRNAYDHLGRRVQKITPEATHTFFYDSFGRLIASSGPMADVFSIRYSTKYFGPESAGMLARIP